MSKPPAFTDTLMTGMPIEVSKFLDDGQGTEI